MPKVQRFWYVGAARGLVHRSMSRIEGDLTLCGKPVRLGWKWWLGSTVPRERKLCEKCE